MSDRKTGMKTDKKNENKTGRRNTLLNIVIVILTFILFCMTIAVVINTKPRVGILYGPEPAQALIRMLERGRYNELMEEKYNNEMEGATVLSNSAYAIPYAAADYYEAAINYYGYLSAGEGTLATPYKKTMNESRNALGEYAYVADDIDALLTSE